MRGAVRPAARPKAAALEFGEATEDDAPEVVAVLVAAAQRLTEQYGRGRWSWTAKERGVLAGIRTSRVLVLRDQRRIVATLRLTSRRPWAIKLAPFTPMKRPLYLVDMAVVPELQRGGAGRTLLEHAEAVARALPADAIRLDAFDAAAGAAPFYARCGYREVAHTTYRGVPLVYFEKVLTP
jgi:GNAT superfamily N-acetyltransferase